MGKKLSPLLIEQQLRQQIRAAYTHAERASTLGALHYLQHVVIDSRPEPKAFRVVAEPWQMALAARYAPAFDHIAGIKKDYTGPYGLWTTLAKGHDKSSFVARLLNFAIAFGRRPFTGYVAAADKEQAGFLAEAMLAEARLNPWLGKRLLFRNWEITGASGALVKIVASDAASLQGIRPDLLVLDEVTHWRDRDLYDNLKSGWRKRPGAVMVVITNAGLKYTWCWEELEAAKADPEHWWVYEAPGRLAGWMDEKAIEADRRTMPPGLARRLFDNAWVDPAEASHFVSWSEALACEELGRQKGLLYRTRGDPEKAYVASVDYGPVRDRTALVVMHQENGCAIVDRLDVLEGKNFTGGRVSLAVVEAWVEEIRKHFNIELLVLDPYQLEALAQKYEGTLPLVRFEARGGKNNYHLATTLRTRVANRQIAWYPDCGLVFVKHVPHTLTNELAEVVCKVMSYGFRIDHLPQRHDDRVIAVGQAVVHLADLRPRRKIYLGDYFW